MANTNPTYLRAVLHWLRTSFGISEERLRARIYLHDGLDLAAAQRFWSEALGVAPQQFHKPYRAVADASIRSRKHQNGCATIVYSDSLLHRRVMARVRAIASRFDLPG